MNQGERFNPFRMFRGAWVPEQLLRNKGVSRGACVLYGVLGRYAGEDGLCFPHQDRLADDLGAGKRSVERWTAELKRLKLIAPYRVPGRRGQAYAFLWNNLLETQQLTLPFPAKMAVLEPPKWRVNPSPDIISEESPRKESHLVVEVLSVDQGSPAVEKKGAAGENPSACETFPPDPAPTGRTQDPPVLKSPPGGEKRGEARPCAPGPPDGADHADEAAVRAFWGRTVAALAVSKAINGRRRPPGANRPPAPPGQTSLLGSENGS